MTWLIAICVSLAFTLSILIVPIVRGIARRIGVVDRPDAERKLHSSPVALGGGVAVFTALIATFVVVLLIDRRYFGWALGTVDRNWYVLFAAAAAMLLVGLLDDIVMIRGRQKLLLQSLIVAAVVGSGTLIERISLPGMTLDLGVFAFPVTVAWLLLAVNALNLIDGADGMASTAGAIICLGFGFLSLQQGNPLSSIVGFALAGCLAGFLVYNRPPASIYLGDAGSMTIGLLIGALAVWSSVKESTMFASAPIAILAIPLFDSTAAILRRWLTGRSIYATDRAHVHHLLQEKFGKERMLWVVASVCTITTAFAVGSVALGESWIAAFGLLIVLALSVLTRTFGHAEVRLLTGRAIDFSQSLTRVPKKTIREVQQRQVSLQGVGNWETVWEPLVAFAAARGFVKLKIDLNLSWIHEGYHATWQGARLPEKANQLHVAIPLFTQRDSGGQQVVGRLEFTADAHDPSAYELIGELSDQLADLGPQINHIVHALEVEQMMKQSEPEPIEDIEAETDGEDVEYRLPVTVESDA